MLSVIAHLSSGFPAAAARPGTRWPEARLWHAAEDPAGDPAVAGAAAPSWVHPAAAVLLRGQSLPRAPLLSVLMCSAFPHGATCFVTVVRPIALFRPLNSYR